MEHIHGNWPGAIPEVHRWPYDYSKPGAELDYIPQDVPMGPDEKMRVIKTLLFISIKMSLTSLRTFF